MALRLGLGSVVRVRVIVSLMVYAMIFSAGVLHHSRYSTHSASIFRVEHFRIILTVAKTILTVASLSD